MNNAAAVVALVMAIGSVAPAWAQEKTDFAALQTTLKQEDNVTLTTLAGDKIKGQLLEVSANQIVLRAKDGLRAVEALQIQKVQKRKNGVLLGAVIGAGAMIPVSIAMAGYGSNEGVGGEGVGGADAISGIVLGLGVGIGIDAAIGSNKTLYERNSGRTVTVAPLIDKKGGIGGRVAIKF